jgi:muconolactone delta-isomerase
MVVDAGEASRCQSGEPAIAPRAGLTEGAAMEYLVAMTTHVPDGTPEQDVDDIRARESAHSAELAVQRHLLRLWRPPLQPGEWRSLGLFAADDEDKLEGVLASMPLRVWRTDQVTALAPHPNDPGVAKSAGNPEFLISMNIAVPAGLPEATVAETNAREADRARELAGHGHLLRLWSLPAEPAQWRTLGLWSAGTPSEMQEIVAALPQYDWMIAQTTPLSPHPSDPG